MNLRWLLFDYVDPQLPLTRAERRTVRQSVRRVSRSLGWSNRRHAVLGSLWGLIPPLCMAIAFAIGMVIGFDHVWVVAVVLLIQLVLDWLLMAVTGWWVFHPLVIEALRREGFLVCERCGYWLRELDDPSRCPECGTQQTESSAE